jgi:hypothetical protein
MNPLLSFTCQALGCAQSVDTSRQVMIVQMMAGRTLDLLLIYSPERRGMQEAPL